MNATNRIKNLLPAMRSMLGWSGPALNPLAGKGEAENSSESSNELDVAIIERSLSVSTKPVIYVMKDSSSKIDFEIHKRFGRYARVRSYSSLYAFYNALSSAAAAGEDIALVVVSDALARFELLTFLAFMRARGETNAADVLYLAQEESLLFRDGRVVLKLATPPATRQIEVAGAVKRAIERFYLSVEVPLSYGRAALA